MPNDRESQRRRVSQACKPCANRKIKCDGSTPRCGRCTSDNIHCFYSISKRNTRSPAQSLCTPEPLQPMPVMNLTSLSSQTRDAIVTAHDGNSRGSASSRQTLNGINESNQLLQAYFRFIHPIWPLLYKPLYDSLDCKQLLRVIPSPLIYAIHSLAVLIEHVDTNGSSKQDRAQQYFDNALTEMSSNVPTPKNNLLGGVKSSITNCQVYTILALQQHSVGAFSQAGILCAIAASMAIDQSLHRTSSTDNHVEAQVKSRLWWNIYVLEKMLSCEMSRPILLRVEEVEIPFPSIGESDEYELCAVSSHADVIVEQRISHSLRSRTISAFHNSIEICKLLEKVSREIYSMAARQNIRKDREFGERTRLRLWTELQEYESSMGNSSLKLDTSGKSESLPVIVTNYVYMWLTMILLHRPFIENWDLNQTITSTSASQSHPSEICLGAANQICSTLSMYTKYMSGLPCDMIFPIFVTANILLQRWRQIGDADIDISPRLELCLKWLNGLGKNWKSAEERQQILSESIDSCYRHDAQVQEETSTATGMGTSRDDYSSLAILTMDDSFDFEYTQWASSWDPQNSAEQ